jgi:hypothetical protein
MGTTGVQGRGRAEPAKGARPRREVADLTAAEILAIGSNRFAVGYTCILDACPHCGNPVPLGAPSEAIECPRCRSEVRLGADLWAKVLRIDGVLALVESTPEGHLREHEQPEVPSAGQRVRVKRVFYKHPVCVACRAPLGEAGAAWSAAEVVAPCSRCGFESRFLPPPAFVPQSPTRVTHVAPSVSGTAGPSSLPARAESPEGPEALTCPSCGGALELPGGGEYAVRCEFCGVGVRLPGEPAGIEPASKAVPWVAVHEVTRAAFVEAARRSQSGVLVGALVAGIIYAMVLGVGPLVGGIVLVGESRGSVPKLAAGVALLLVFCLVAAGIAASTARALLRAARRKKALLCLAASQGGLAQAPLGPGRTDARDQGAARAARTR